MAKEILVGELLTEEMLEAGRRLLADVKQPLEVVAAFWLYFPEPEEWRLALVTPRVDTDGPLELYTLLGDQIYTGDERARVYGLELSNLTVLSPRDRLVEGLIDSNRNYRKAAGRDLPEQRLRGIYLDGSYVPDLYLYFIEDTPKPRRKSNGRSNVA